MASCTVWTVERHPIDLRGNASAAQLAREVVAVLEGQRGRAALATVIGRSGSAPQVVGAKLLLHEGGAVVGTVGGGAIEAQVVESCQAVLRDGRSRRVQANLVKDLAMCCGGSMEVFVEYLQPQLRLVVIGAGHVAQAVVPVATLAGFRLTVVDDREELLDHPAFAAVETLALDVDELADADLGLTERDFVLVMTRDHRRDEIAVAQLVRGPHRYLGMIGSRRKVHTVLRRILAREAGLDRPEPDLSRLRAPIGFDLGGRTPGEIAVAIVAELIAVRYEASGALMDRSREAAAKARAAFGDPDESPGGASRSEAEGR